MCARMIGKIHKYILKKIIIKVHFYPCALPEQGSRPSFHGKCRRRLGIEQNSERKKESKNAWPFCSPENQWMDKNKSFFLAVSQKEGF